MHIAMIGIKAIPARFGGFETAVDELSRGLVKLGHQVVVYNRTGMSSQPVPLTKELNWSRYPLSVEELEHYLSRFPFDPPRDVPKSRCGHYFTTGATLFAPLPRLMGRSRLFSGWD